MGAKVVGEVTAGVRHGEHARYLPVFRHHHRPEVLLLFETEEPDLVLDVTGHGPTKVHALEAHESQFETTMGIDDTDDAGQRAEFGTRIIDELAATGAPHGFAEAEAFRLLSL